MKQKWIKRGDKVLVISGNDKGKMGEVLGIKESRILVQGVNIRKKHMKAQQQGQKSEIISIERPIHLSNVALCDSEGNKLKLNVKHGQDGSKELIYNENGKEMSYRTLKKPRKG